MIRLLIDGNDIPFEITKFPDGTSQVWKVDQNLPLPLGVVSQINWIFENEAEVMHVAQLRTYLEARGFLPKLYVPFLPYGRQDKIPLSGGTFARFTFLQIVGHVETFDAHSLDPLGRITSRSPEKFQRHAFAGMLDEGPYDRICFPDQGAAKRYGYSLADLDASPIVAHKIRDQETGEIQGIGMPVNESAGAGQIEGRRILIIDDICDGGRTFIEVARILQDAGAGEIGLAVSHGIFSKGRDVLYEAGILRIFTTNSVWRNSTWTDSYEVW